MIIHIQYKVYMCLNAYVFTPIKSTHTYIYIYTHIYIYIVMLHCICRVLTLQDRESHGTSCSQDMLEELQHRTASLKTEFFLCL